jgi:hypothetical protein
MHPRIKGLTMTTRCQLASARLARALIDLAGRGDRVRSI